MRAKLFLIFLVFLRFTSNAQKSTIEDRVIDSVFALKEVKQRIQYVENESKGTRHLSLVVFEKPSKLQPYYWVKAWEDNGMNYVTHFNFFVYPGTFEVRFYDAVTDSVLTLRQWRRD